MYTIYDMLIYIVRNKIDNITVNYRKGKRKLFGTGLASIVKYFVSFGQFMFRPGEKLEFGSPNCAQSLRNANRHRIHHGDFSRRQLTLA